MGDATKIESCSKVIVELWFRHIEDRATIQGHKQATVNLMRRSVVLMTIVSQCNIVKLGCPITAGSRIKSLLKEPFLFYISYFTANPINIPTFMTVAMNANALTWPNSSTTSNSQDRGYNCWSRTRAGNKKTCIRISLLTIYHQSARANK